ncbi:MAG TPA: hypothetical protein VNB22_19630, partial [Pyrinomonadaceae bacterium]|nr:hypothetical protein [Pyrinomonadaceae bacterium]
MNQKNGMTIILAAIAGALGALVVCTFFFFYYKPAAQNAETPKPIMKQEEPTPPKRTEPIPPPSEDVNASDVEALTIETVYKNFYAEGSKCRQTYNEYFKNTDGVGSSSSPCSVKLTFNRDGSAEKTIEVHSYEKDAKQWRVVEKSVWKSKVSEAEFKELAQLIVNNDAFKAWNDMTLINVSNCKITVRHTSGTKSPMSNVDEKATAYLPMVEAFKKLD